MRRGLRWWRMGGLKLGKANYPQPMKTAQDGAPGGSLYAHPVAHNATRVG